MTDTINNGTTHSMAEPIATTDQPSSNGPTVPTNSTLTDTKHDTNTTVDSHARKPRDARVIHLILASMGVSSYQERVPLMLMDFAYRYTSSVLQDALLFSDAINNTANTGGQNPSANIVVDDLRMSIASRVNHQFSPGLPKDFLLDIAQERNRVALPTVGPEFGVRLPPEKYCLTGINWDLAQGMEEWMEVTDSEEDEEMQAPPMTGAIMGMGGGLVGADDEDGDKMDGDLFGGSTAGDGDSNMIDA